MVFSDDDLKRLKKAIVDHLEARAIAGAYELPALLARLEAAERCVYPSTDFCVICHCEDCQSNREAHRKAAGK